MNETEAYAERAERLARYAVIYRANGANSDADICEDAIVTLACSVERKLTP